MVYKYDSCQLIIYKLINLEKYCTVADTSIRTHINSKRITSRDLDLWITIQILDICFLDKIPVNIKKIVKQKNYIVWKPAQQSGIIKLLTLIALFPAVLYF